MWNSQYCKRYHKRFLMKHQVGRALVEHTVRAVQQCNLKLSFNMVNYGNNGKLITDMDKYGDKMW